MTILGKPQVLQDIGDLKDITSEHSTQLEETTNQISTINTSKADKGYVDNQISQIGNASPKGTYATLTALQTAHPTGTTGIYIVASTGHWFYWNGSVWADGGAYQSTTLADRSVLVEKTDFITTGKNKFDKTKRAVGYRIYEVDGTLAVASTYDTSDYIPVKSGDVITISTKCRYYAFYNTSKTFISAVNNSSYNTVTITAPSDGYLRFTTGTAFVDTSQVELNSSATTYEAFKYVIDKIKVEGTNITNKSIDNINIKDETLTEDKVNPASNIVVKKVGKNIININNLVSGYYISYLDGLPKVGASYSYADYIKIKPSATYAYSSSGGSLQQLAYYDENKVFISGNAGGTSPITLTTPSNARYMRVTVTNAYKNFNLQIEEGSTPTTYEPYQVGINVDEIIGLAQNMPTITVKKDGTGDFTTIRSAIESITDSGVNKFYKVQIYEGSDGIYDIFSEYTTTELENVNFKGLYIPNYTKLEGIGNVTIKGELATSLNAQFNLISTLNLNQVCDLENLTITSKNCRYAVHDDPPTSSIKIVHNLRKCKFIKYTGTVGYSIAYGSGCRSGAVIDIDDCDFESEMNFPYSIHNNVSFTEPMHLKINNSRFLNKNGSTNYSIALLSMGSGTEDIVELIGCYTPKGVSISENAGSEGCGIDMKVTGYGNTISMNKITNTIVQEVVGCQFNEEMSTFITWTNVSKGQPVSFYNTNRIRHTGTETAVNCIGVAMQSGIQGDSIVVRTNGYAHYSELGLGSINNGDKVGIVGEVFAVVTSGDYIGICNNFDGFVKLKFN